MKYNNDIGGVDSQMGQLLDTSTNFDNSKDLSYFINEYNKAKEIIKQCKTFYSNFLKTKLYSYDQIIKMPSLNLVDLKFESELFKKHCDNLANFIIYEEAIEHIFSKLSKYKIEFDCEYLNERSIKHVIYTYLHIKPLDGLIDSKTYLDVLSRYIGIHNENAKRPWYERSDIVKYGEVSASYVDKRYVSCNNVEKIVKSKKTFYKFTNEEYLLFDLIKEFNNEFNRHDIYLDILKNPWNYKKEWERYVDVVLSKCKDIEDQGYPYVKYFAPASFIDYKYKSPYRHAVEAIDFINKDFLEFITGTYEYIIHYDEKPKEPFIYVKSGQRFYNDKYVWYSVGGNTNERFSLEDYLYINTGDLINHIKEKYDMHIPEQIEHLDKKYYYAIINGTPLMFTDNINKVKINYNKSHNILECEYQNVSRHKKWTWPTNGPYVNTTTTYSLLLDCSTNESIMYQKHIHIFEEKY